ncbi:unnamed protein product [Euphydryas editha]|uniref:Uncharacterized protein n=1 Tax=Euphydryas editha TaxID=104508 RepID=A0AAU9TDN5_EUPED|nr:unnamed protein product [Euphydryas editha]
MAKRRKWIDDLKKEFNNDEENTKKIKVLSEKIYLHGKLCKVTNFEEKENYNSNKCEHSLILPSTPLKHRYCDSLIPTFRYPNPNVIETNKVLKKMTPKKLSYVSNQIEDNIISTSEIIHDEFSSTTFNELTNLQSLNCQNINNNNSSPSISVSVDHLSENSSQHYQNCPGPRTNDELVTYRAASVLQSPSHRPGTSEELVTYQADSVPRSPSHRLGTSDEIVTYRPASALRSPSHQPGTSEESVTYRAASVPRSPSPRPGTSNELVTYRGVCESRSPSPRPGKSDELVTYQAVCVPRTETSNEQICIVHYSPEERSFSKNVASKKHQPKRKVKRDCGTKPAFDESYIDFTIDKEDRDTLILNEVFPSEESNNWNNLTSDESDEELTKKKENQNSSK